MLLTVLLIGGVSGFLLISRAAQTTGAAESTAANRASVAVQLLEKITQPQVLFATGDLASTYARALTSAADPTDISHALSSAPPHAPDVDLAVLDRNGVPIPGLGAASTASRLGNQLQSVQLAMSFSGSASHPPCGVSVNNSEQVTTCGVEFAGPQLPAYDAVAAILVPAASFKTTPIPQDSACKNKTDPSGNPSARPPTSCLPPRSRA